MARPARGSAGPRRRPRPGELTLDRPIRAFIAIALPDEALADCVALIESARSRHPTSAVKWVRPEGLHMTLRFLGAVELDRLSATREAVDQAASTADPFSVTLTDAGAFPSARRPRTLWLGVGDGAATVSALAATLEDRLSDAGWPRESRPFRSHLTVARADQSPDAASLAGLLVGLAGDWRTTFRVDRLILFRSLLGRGSAVYEQIHTARLG